MGINPEYFFNKMSLTEAMHLLKEYDENIKLQAERHRELCYPVWVPILKKPIPTMQRFMPFSWDKAPKPMTKEEFNADVEKLRKLKII